MTLKTLMATLPDGITIKRKTHHDYILVVCGRDERGWFDELWTTQQKYADQRIRLMRGHCLETTTVQVYERPGSRRSGHRGGVKTVKNYMLSFLVPQLSSDKEITDIADHLGAERSTVLPGNPKAVVIYNSRGWNNPTEVIRHADSFQWKPYLP